MKLAVGDRVQRLMGLKASDVDLRAALLADQHGTITKVRRNGYEDVLMDNGRTLMLHRSWVAKTKE